MGPATVTTETVTDQAPERGLEELYLRHAPAALRLAYFLTGDLQIAEDLVQDAFVRLAARLAHVRHRDAFETYLRRTVTNLFLSHLRRLRLERTELARQRSERRPMIVLEDGSDRDELRRALRALPERQRAAIVLRFYEDLSERETADVMRCSVRAVNSLVVRAMATLRAQMGGGEP
jgi:RNA polymerase sigma-70 factor (sigma-E family)